MPRYSRHRPIPDTYTHSCVGRKQRRKQEQDTAKNAKNAERDKGLLGGAPEPEGRPGGTEGPGGRNQRAGAGRRRAHWFAKGPVYLDQAARVARKGGCAVVVWLAVRALEDYASGSPATTARITEVTGLGDRTVRKAVAALVEIGMLKRDGDRLTQAS